jgi:RHS repeat-associated protein
VRWYVTDRQGSVLELLDQNGVPVTRDGYSGFGGQLHTQDAGWVPPAATINNPYQYTGRYFEATTGLQYNRSRWYNPLLGRWMNPDPLGFAAGDSNLYRYVGNSPTNYTDPSGLDWSDTVVSWLPNSVQWAIAGRRGDAFSQVSDFSAGAWDTVSLGLTALARRGLGFDDAVDYQSGGYQAGVYTGRVINLALLATPAGWVQSLRLAAAAGGAARWAWGTYQAVQGLQLVGGTVQGAQAALNGDWASAGLAFLGVGLTGVRGMTPSGWGNAALAWGQRGLHVAGTVTDSLQALQEAQSGDWLGAALSLGSAVVNGARIYQSCFCAGTPLLTPEGSTTIELSRVGDLVLSRSDDDTTGPLVAKVVEEVFIRQGRILELRVRGRVIGTTAEHPFWVYNRGWFPAGELRVGEWLLSHDGQWVVVEEVKETGRVETVYNLRVSDFHTYFVGGEDWGFSVWAHNAYDMKAIQEHLEGDVQTLSLPKDKAGRVDLRKQLRAEFGESPDTKIAYVLYDKTTGEVYKVGRTSVGPDARNLNERFVNEYARGQSKLAAGGVEVDLAVDYAVLKPSSVERMTPPTLESALRSNYESRGFRLYWDNTEVAGVGNRLGFSGSGLPWKNQQALDNWLPNRRLPRPNGTGSV